MSSKGNSRENGDTHWCSRHESVVLCKAGDLMGRGRGGKGTST